MKELMNEKFQSRPPSEAVERGRFLEDSNSLRRGLCLDKFKLLARVKSELRSHRHQHSHKNGEAVDKNVNHFYGDHHSYLFP